MPKALQPHPLADLLPPMSDAEYAALKADIAANGQVEDIFLLDGKILDGRHRYRACQELKIEPRVRPYKGKQCPLAFVCSKTIHRNMDGTQKACAAALVEPELAKDAAARMKAGKRLDATEQAGLARDHAARIFGISGAYVSAAKAILAADRKLFDACFNGHEKLSRAKAQVRRALRAKLRSAASAQAGRTLVAGRGNFKLECRDSIQYLRSFKPSASLNVKLIVADPPYNIGIDYGDGEDSDRLTASDYRRFIGRWIEPCWTHLTDDGSLVIIINDEWAAEHVVAAKQQGFLLRNWIKWYETFGTNCANKFNRTSRHVLYFTKDPGAFTFRPEIFTRPSARQLIYGDKRAATHGKLWDDVWIIPRLVENAEERVTGFPTQLPLALLRPIVQGLSNPGDHVLDPFNGSGTTGHAAIECGRHYLGIDKSAAFVELARERLSIVTTQSEAAAK